MAHAGASSTPNAQWPTLKEYAKAHSAPSNDCDWLHKVVSSNAISTGTISPNYLVKVYYKETKAASITTAKNFGTRSFELLGLRENLASKYIRAVILCHRDSSQVDPDILDLLWTKFQLDVSFMRHHLDYKEFRDEPGCPREIRDWLEWEDGQVEDDWTFGGRWNPIRLPSETRGSILRLSVDSECLSVCCRGNTIIALVRSKAVYLEPQPSHIQYYGRKRRSCPCAVDLFAATANISSINHAIPSDQSEFSCSIVHFYARLLVLRCYEDYNLRHDTQPINVNSSDRVASIDHPHLMAMHRRRLEMVRLKQDLFAYLGPLAPGPKSLTVRKDSDSAENVYDQKLRSLLTDVEMLLSLYDNTMRIYEWNVHETDSDYKAELASEQLEETKQSKATAISLSRLSNLAFLYLPINFVCAMLGMNLSIFGQGQVPVWVFLMLVLFFGLLTYLPIYLPAVDQRRILVCRVAYQLSRRSRSAGFWFLAFTLTHSYHQIFEIKKSGLTQVLLGHTYSRTKGWTGPRDDRLFQHATLGSQAFWKKKVEEFMNAVEELRSSGEATELTV